MCVFSFVLFDHARTAEGSARPLFPQWSHHVYPQFLPGTHPNAQVHHTYVRHRHTYVKHNHYNLNNNHHSHYPHYKIDHRYHRSHARSAGTVPTEPIVCNSCWMSFTARLYHPVLFWLITIFVSNPIQ